jgi:hypothetical protein
MVFATCEGHFRAHFCVVKSLGLERRARAALLIDDGTLEAPFSPLRARWAEAAAAKEPAGE